MSIFEKCDWEECTENASTQCTKRETIKNLCSKHLISFIDSGETEFTGKRLHAPAEAEDLTMLGKCQDLLKSVTKATLAQSSESMHKLVGDLRRLIGEIEAEVQSIHSESQSMQAELREILEAKKIPIGVPGTFIGEVSTLKAQADFTLPSIEDAMRRILLSVDIEPPREYRELLQRAGDALEALESRIYRKAKFNDLFRLENSRHVNGRTAAEKIQALCRLGHIFENLELRAIDLSNTDLSGGVFINTRFHSVNLSGARADKAIFWQVK